MAAYTASVTGDWDNSATWGGGGVPGDGDTCVINNGITVTVTSNVTVGATTGTLNSVVIGQAGATAANYAKLVVDDGVTLTLKGVSTTYFAMKILQWGQLVPSPGARIEVDCDTDGDTGILVQGIIDAQGTANDYITFSVPAANVHWDTTQTSITQPQYSAYFVWDTTRNIACVDLRRSHGNSRISNAAGTGIGTMSPYDTSVSISSQSPADIIETGTAARRKNSIDEISQAGDFYIDHATAFIYFYYDYPTSGATALPSFSVTYTYLDPAQWRGWCMDISQSGSNQSGCEGKFDYCIFEYMGKMAVSGRLPALRAGYRGAGLGSDREFYVTNSIFRWCSAAIWTCGTPSPNGGNKGTTENPILIDGNTFYGVDSAFYDTGGHCITFNNNVANTNEYITVSNNNFNCRVPIDGAGGVAGVGEGYTKYLKIQNNTFTNAVDCIRTFHPPGDIYSSSEISGNTLQGVGYAANPCRGLLDLQGDATGDIVITGNTIRNFRYGCSVNRYGTIEKNIFYQCYMLGVNFGSGFHGYAPNVTIQNNLFCGEGKARTSAPSYKSYDNYGHIAIFIPNVGNHVWLHNLLISNNTCANQTYQSIALGNTLGGMIDSVFLTRARITNNLLYEGACGVERKADTASYDTVRGALALFDYNLLYGQDNYYLPAGGSSGGIYRQATFVRNSTEYNLDATRNLTGVELWNPSYSSAQSSGRTLALTVTDFDTDLELTWDSGGSGVAQQLRWQNGTLGDGTGETYAMTEGFGGAFGYVTLTDSSQSWSTDRTNADCPIGRICKVMRGATPYWYFIRKCTSTTLELISHNEEIPTDGDSYYIYNSLVTLSDGVSDTVEAGIDYRYLPTSTNSDTGITIALNAVEGSDPTMVSPTGATATNYQIQTGSPAIGAGTATGAPTDDYWGTSRQTPGQDIGFHEYFVGVADNLRMNYRVL